MTFRVDDFRAQVSKGGGFASQNMFRVQMPRIQGAPLGGNDPRELDMLCRVTGIPGRQVLSVDKQIGTVLTKVANGYAVGDVSMTFYCMNDYGIRRYFETWQNLAHNQETKTIGYFKDYAKPVVIQQLKKGVSFPIKKRKVLDTSRIPTGIRNRLPRIGPLDLAQGEIDLDGIFGDQIAYTCVLENAYPTTLNEIALNNETQDIVEVSVQLSYKDWRSEQGDISSGLVEGLAGELIRRVLN